MRARAVGVRTGRAPAPPLALHTASSWLLTALRRKGLLRFYRIQMTGRWQQRTPRQVTEGLAGRRVQGTQQRGLWHAAVLEEFYRWLKRFRAVYFSAEIRFGGVDRTSCVVPSRRGVPRAPSPRGRGSGAWWAWGECWRELFRARHVVTSLLQKMNDFQQNFPHGVTVFCV